MNGKPPERTQDDGLGDIYSEATYVFTPPEENQTRSEFAADSDINSLITRYGAVPGTGRPQSFGSWDYDMDLLNAYTSVEQARMRYEELPQEVKDHYPSWESLAREIERGQLDPALARDLDAEIRKAQKAQEATASAGAEGASATEGRQPPSAETSVE